MSIEREEFEQAVTDRWSDSYSFTRFGDEDYYDEVLEGMWWGWQASRQVDGESVAYQYWWPESPRQVTVCKAKDLPSGGPDLIVQPLYTHPASAEVERLRSRVAELVAVAVSVRDDLLLRSEIDSDGTRCVNLSASKWSSFCDVIDEAAKAEGADNAG
jgi:hypothetical protein